MLTRRDLSFWYWFAHGGYGRLIDLWLAGHVCIGLALTLACPGKLSDLANSALLPIVGMLIGLMFSWSANINSLLQSDEIRQLAESAEGGYREYVFTYQLGVSVVLFALLLWAIAGIGVFDTWWPVDVHRWAYLMVKCALLAVCSLTVRECWRVVMGGQLMLLTQDEIRKAK